MISTIVDAWDPAWATFTSHALRSAQGAGPGKIVVGWLTYVTSPLASPLPEGITREPLGAGSLITTGETPMNVTVDQVIATRQAAGLE